MPRKKPQKKTAESAEPPSRDEAAASRVERFFSVILKHSKGKNAGQPFLLLPWQRRVLGDIFGTLKQDGTRQYRTAYIELGCALGP